MVFASFLPKKGTITALPKNFAITKALGNQVAPTSYVKTFSDVSQSKWAVPQNYYPIQRIISKYYPNLSNSDMILMASKLSPIYMRNASLSVNDVDNAYAEVRARKNMQIFPYMIQDKLTEIYNALTDDKKLKVLESGTPARDLGLEGEVDDTTLRRIISDAVDLGPDFKFDIPTPEGGFTSMPTYTEFATPETEFATTEDKGTELSSEKFLRFKNLADNYLKEAAVIGDALPLEKLDAEGKDSNKIWEDALKDHFGAADKTLINKIFGDLATLVERASYLLPEVAATTSNYLEDPTYIESLQESFAKSKLGEGLKRRKKNKTKKRKVIYY